jgi:monofunctional biosynthetic peptidoglycan transglycosylase
VRKGLEAWFTVLLELLWPKRRILEVYLNVAQFGPRAYGVAAGSRAWFGREPERLSRYQMSLLAATLPDPVDLRPDAPGQGLRERASFVREHMASLGGVAYLEAL